MFHVKRGRKTSTAVSTDVQKSLPPPTPAGPDNDMITEPQPVAQAQQASSSQGADMGVIIEGRGPAPEEQ